ncbi:TPA: hypothetical protein N0F65_009498 [Lagenidium giganteum]|uniref:Uncharacterized protein n=1 Tax=Lagenidium giganteum TaxID=4803 RepID=A0AAV2ZHG3_9STRA|nr:TPA: hypothetical protein N0F65_009498 [Lagenidium giganteum]
MERRGDISDDPSSPRGDRVLSPRGFSHFNETPIEKMGADAATGDQRDPRSALGVAHLSDANVAGASPRVAPPPRRQGAQRASSQPTIPALPVPIPIQEEPKSTPRATLGNNIEALASGDEFAFILPEMSKDGDATGRFVRETWSADHVMVLYMLSRYAVCARTIHDRESWIRQIPLLVLMYEGITAGVLNFDYAPAPILIAQQDRPKRLWLNVTQDGKSAIDDLREASLINGLKLSTRDYHSITAFQVSMRGLELLKQVGTDVRTKVEQFIVAPTPYRRELLQIRYVPIKDEPENEVMLSMSPSSWSSSNNLTANPQTDTAPASTSAPEIEFNEEGRFILESIGYFRYSAVTETEDVSYVSSPYVSQCVRGVDAFQPLSSNAHRASEAAGGQSNIRDTLSEAMILTNPVCLIGEWIPFGSNQIVALNERLGSMDRCQGGLFTSLIDDRPTETKFEVPPGLTQVRILDYNPVQYINFEAEINFPEEDGIVQIENFGIHLNVDGTIFYGIRVEAILDKSADRISIDMLSRLLVDIHQDSSEVMDDLLSSYQSSLLDMVFLGDAASRGKFNLIMADQIDPFMLGVEYMDRGDYENELKQVLGDLHSVYDIGDDSVLIVGQDGMLIAGPAGKRFEKVFIAYFALHCREIFLRSFYTRIFVLEERLRHIRGLFDKAHENPTFGDTARVQLSDATNDLILFTDTLGYLLESLEFVKIPRKSHNASAEEEVIFSYLNLEKQHRAVLTRARELEKLVHGAKNELANLRQMTELLDSAQLETIFSAAERNTKILADDTLDIRNWGDSLEAIGLLAAGLFSFAVLDRLPGGTLNLSPPSWVEKAFTQIVDVPFLFFVLNVAWMSLAIALLKRYFEHRRLVTTSGRETLRIRVDKPIDIAAFEAFIATRQVLGREATRQIGSEIYHVKWREYSGLPCPALETHTKNRNKVRKETLSWKEKVARFFCPALWRWWRVRRIVATGGTPIKLATVNVPDIRGDDHMPGKKKHPSRSPIDVEVEFENRHGFLLYVTFHVQSRRKRSQADQPAVESDARRISTFLKLIAQESRNFSSKRLSTKPMSVSGQGAPSGVDVAVVEKENAGQPSDTAQWEAVLLLWLATELKEHRVVSAIEDILNSSA